MKAKQSRQRWTDEFRDEAVPLMLDGHSAQSAGLQRLPRANNTATSRLVTQTALHPGPSADRPTACGLPLSRRMTQKIIRNQPGIPRHAPL
jgi:hypothetical protein